MDAATLLYVHDHLIYPDPLALDGSMFDAREHDPRCSGDCHPCAGEGGAYGYACLTCGGSGVCPGCNAYVRLSERAA